MPPVKIYVGNIHSSARSAELKELFEKFGKVVECDILKDFGFVHMEDTNDAKAAIAGLNDTLWKGARIRVEISTTKTSKGEPSLRHKSDRRSESGGAHRRPSSASYRHNPISHHRSSGRGPMPPPPPPMMHRDGYLPSSPSRSRNGGGPIRDSRYSSSSNGSSSRYDRGGRGAPMPPPPYPDRGYDRGGPLLPPPPMPPNGSRNGDSYGRERNGYPHHHPYMRPGGHVPPPPPPPPHHDDYYRGSNGSMGIPPGMPPPPPPSSSRYEFDQYGPPSSRARYSNSYK